MKTVAENHALSLRRSGNGHGADDWLLSQLGEDLRDLYREVTEAEQPADLMELALTIDALRAGSEAGG